VEEAIDQSKLTKTQKQNYVKLPKWLVIVVVILLLIVVAVGMLVAGIMLEKNQNVAVPKTVSVATPTPIATLTPTVSPTAKSTPQFPVSTNPNLVRFTSEKLGVSFTYLKSQNGQTVSVKEVDDKVYVYADNTNPTNGQYLQVMPKDKNQTLEQAIKFLILNGYSTSDCPIQPATQYVPVGFEALEITVPFNQNDTQDQIIAKSGKCPTTFTAMGGMAYFVEDPNYPDKMIFLSIGQYLINSEGDNQGWQNTLQVF
jgi:hypothetical protein